MSFQIDFNNLKRGWKKYYIMHMDRRVATIREDGGCTIYAKSFMPYNLYFETDDSIDSRINNLNNFYYWCASRVLTLDRKYVKEILGSLHATQARTDKDRAAIALSYHCLCLTDVYWVCGVGEKISFF